MPFSICNIIIRNTSAVSPAKYSINIINNICLPSGITKEVCLIHYITLLYTANGCLLQCFMATALKLYINKL